MADILVIDDEANICRSFELYFRDLGHAVVSAPSGERGLEEFKTNPPDAVILDVRLPGRSGLEILGEIRKLDTGVPVIIITGHGTMDTAVTAMQSGAFDYLTKPVDLQKAREIVEKALKSVELSRRLEKLREETAHELDSGLLTGRSPVMQELYKRIGAVAGSDASILIVGESGVGKELVARAIHENSPRHGKPFEPVQCAALPATLIESELYGYEKGAFTGADASKPGKFSVADGGTIFLDEVGELPTETQVKLLRFLQEKTVEPLGSTRRIKLDVRVLAATNAPLAERIKTGKFREDLYFRLAVVTIDVPPLRVRMDDIPLLVERFLEENGKADAALTPEALEVLCSYDWPGNVRELRNAVEHAGVLARGTTILPEHLPERVRSGAPDAKALETMLSRLVKRIITESDIEDLTLEKVMVMWEKPVLQAVFEMTRGNKRRTAEILKITRTTLRKKLRRHDIEGPGGKS
ncbi:MAG: sigma-54-dependent transcriptional regulator [Planctomycetota bacterium]|jgi:DNA-binding NtrC family response regulator